MSGRSKKSKPKTCEATPAVISSVASSAGSEPSSSPSFQQADLFGVPASRANPSRSRAKAKASRTNDISGQCSWGSSASASLSSLLASKLQAMLGDTGSPECVLKWRRLAMPSGAPICALRARPRKPRDGLCVGIVLSSGPSPLELLTSGNAFSGAPSSLGELVNWHSPTAQPCGQTPEGWLAKQQRIAEDGRKPPGAMPLEVQAQLVSQAGLATWPSPEAAAFGTADVEKLKARRARVKEKHGNGNGFGLTLHQAAMLFLATWPTPVANDDNKTPEGHLAMKQRMGEREGTNANRTAITSLQVMAQTVLTGWARPTCH